MIPKKIHYCWFGQNQKSDFINECILSWKKHLPDYEIVEWNESNSDLEKCLYVKEATKAKKWAFVSDYVRAYALYHEGGIYLDTDVEIKLPLDSFLHHGAFSGFESKNYPFTAVWGSEQLHNWPKKVLAYYESQVNFFQFTNTQIVSNILINDYGVDATRDERQELAENIVIYPSTHFCLDLPTNFATHHFLGSWLPYKEESYKDKIHKIYIAEKLYSTYDNHHEILDKLRIDGVLSIPNLISFLYKKIKARLL